MRGFYFNITSFENIYDFWFPFFPRFYPLLSVSSRFQNAFLELQTLFHSSRWQYQRTFIDL